MEGGLQQPGGEGVGRAGWAVRGGLYIVHCSYMSWQYLEDWKLQLYVIAVPGGLDMRAIYQISTWRAGHCSYMSYKYWRPIHDPYMLYKYLEAYT